MVRKEIAALEPDPQKAKQKYVQITEDRHFQRIALDEKDPQAFETFLLRMLTASFDAMARLRSRTKIAKKATMAAITEVANTKGKLAD